MGQEPDVAANGDPRRNRGHSIRESVTSITAHEGQLSLRRNDFCDYNNSF